MKQALGLVEIRGMSTAVVVADTMVKAANIRIIEMENTRGLGYMTIKIAGDVGAVNAAVNAGRQIGLLHDKLVSWKVIARPSDYVEQTFYPPEPPKPDCPPDNTEPEEETEPEKIPEPEEETEPEKIPEPEIKPEPAEAVKQQPEPEPLPEIPADGEPASAPNPNPEEPPSEAGPKTAGTKKAAAKSTTARKSSSPRTKK